MNGNEWQGPGVGASDPHCKKVSTRGPEKNSPQMCLLRFLKLLMILVFHNIKKNRIFVVDLITFCSIFANQRKSWWSTSNTTQTDRRLQGGAKTRFEFKVALDDLLHNQERYGSDTM